MLLIDGDIALEDVLRNVVDEARSITGLGTALSASSTTIRRH